MQQVLRQTKITLLTTIKAKTTTTTTMTTKIKIKKTDLRLFLQLGGFFWFHSDTERLEQLFSFIHPFICGVHFRMKFVYFTLRGFKLKKIQVKLFIHVPHEDLAESFIFTSCILLMTCFAMSFQQSSKSFSCVLISLAAGSPLSTFFNKSSPALCNDCRRIPCSSNSFSII